MDEQQEEHEFRRRKRVDQQIAAKARLANATHVINDLPDSVMDLIETVDLARWLISDFGREFVPPILLNN